MDCLIIDDQPVFVLGITALLQRHFPAMQCTPATSLQTVMQQPASRESSSPRLILLGLNAGHGEERGQLADYLDVTTRRGGIVLVLDSVADDTTMNLCENSGARGYLAKSEDLVTLMHAIEVIAAGGRYFSAAERTRPVHMVREGPRFTHRQRDILDLLLTGCSNKRIADQLQLTPGTVKNYIFDLMRLVGATSRLELAMKVKDLGYQTRSMHSPTPKPPRTTGTAPGQVLLT